MRNANVIGPIISRLRSQRGWSQEMLAVKLQVIGCDITRDVIANIELKRCVATDAHIMGFMRVFGVRLKDLFPDEIRELDAKAERLLQARQNGAVLNGSTHPARNGKPYHSSTLGDCHDRNSTPNSYGDEAFKV